MRSLELCWAFLFSCGQRAKRISCTNPKRKSDYFPHRKVTVPCDKLSVRPESETEHMYGKILEKRWIMKEKLTGMCHASTVLKKPDGEILAAWFGGSREGAEDTGIYLSRQKEGEDFSAPELMASGREAHWNPVLFSPDGKTVFLYYKVGMQIAQWRTYVRISEDGGRTFGREQELVPGDRGGRGPVKNKPLRLKNGRVLAPGSLEQGEWAAFARPLGRRRPLPSRGAA